MSFANKTSLFSLLLFFTLITLVPSISSMSPEDQPAAQTKGFCIVGGGGSVEVGTTVANGLLTVSLPASDLQHLLSCRTDKDSWFARCNRCDQIRTNACSAILLSNSQFHPTHIAFNSK